MKKQMLRRLARALAVPRPAPTRQLTQVKLLAMENTLKAMHKLVELIDSTNHNVALGASREVLQMVCGKEPTKFEWKVKREMKPARDIKVRIAHFKEEQDDAS